MAPVPYVSEPFTYAGGAPAAGVLARVYFASTNVLAPVFYDSLSTRAPNPMQTDSAGVLEFYAEPGSYELLVNGLRFPIEVTGDGGPGSPALPFMVFAAGAPGNPGIGNSLVYNDSGRTLQIVSVRVTAASVSSAPLLVDINNSAGTIFTNQAHRPTLPVSAAAGSVKVTTIDVPTLVEGDRLSVDVDQGNFTFLVVQLFVR